MIGTLTERHRGVMPVDVVTGDRDLLQLVDDANGIRVLYTGKGGVRDPDLATRRTSTSGMPCPPARPTSTCRCCAATPATACRGSRASATRPPPS